MPFLHITLHIYTHVRRTTPTSDGQSTRRCILSAASLVVMLALRRGANQAPSCFDSVPEASISCSHTSPRRSLAAQCDLVVPRVIHSRSTQTIRFHRSRPRVSSVRCENLGTRITPSSHLAGSRPWEDPACPSLAPFYSRCRLRSRASPDPSTLLSI